MSGIPGVRVVLSCIAMVAGCGVAGEAGPWPRIGARHDGIKGGEPDDGDTAVIGLRAFVPMALPLNCTGTLIAPNVVLTAWHCVAPVDVGGGGPCPLRVRYTLGPEAIFYSMENPTPLDMEALLPVSEVVTLPGDSMELCGRDQAIVILDRNIPPAQATPMVPRVDVALAAGEIYSAIGFGVTDDQGANDGFVRRRLDGLSVACVAGDCMAPDFSDTEWVGERGVCPGDSGGPAVDTAQRVIGVASRGVVGCVDPTYGYVFGWREWVKSAVLHGAEVGGYAPPPWATGYPTDPVYAAPVGPACAAAAQCASKRCVDGYCTRPCTEVAACPGGFHCAGDPPLCTRDPPSPPPMTGGCNLGPRPTARVPAHGWALLLLGVGAWRRRRSTLRRQ